MLCDIEILESIAISFGLESLGPRFVYEDDNAGLHCSRIIHHVEYTHVHDMEWPAYSPDLNPIEHAWDVLGRAITSREELPTTREELALVLMEERV